ncbi:hypothetical protein ACJZ2D_003064 [Fusarium nematophilum]
MDIKDVFPEDPFEPTVKYIGVNQAPFSVPWAKGRVQLCAGFNTQRADHDDLFMSCTAFRDIPGTPLQYRECQITSIRDESGSSIANSSENRNFAISASTSNISVRADHICGQIEAIHPPQLDKDAVRLLKTSSDPISEFRQTYGDFYVAGYRVGAVNNTTVSGELANKMFFEAKRAELDVKAVFVNLHRSIDDVSQSALDVGGLRVAAFDSLAAFYSDFTALTYEDSIRAGDVASENKQRAMTIAARAAEVLWDEFSLGHEGIVYQDAVDRLCDRGLVTELLLAPFAALREYQSFVSQRFNRK